MWKTEKEFGQYVMTRLKREGYSCMRIESASTIAGCPDLWVQGRGDDYFVELKNMPGKKVYDFTVAGRPVTVHWRPGQQSWAQQYIREHSVYADNVVRTKASWTFVGCADGIVCIRMGTLYVQNKVSAADDRYGGALLYLFDDKSKFYPGRLLNMYSYAFHVTGQHEKPVAVIEVLLTAIRWWMRGRDAADVDWPCYDDIKEEVVEDEGPYMTVGESKRIMELAYSIVRSYLQNEYGKCHED